MSSSQEINKFSYMHGLRDEIFQEATNINFYNSPPDPYWQIEAYRKQFDTCRLRFEIDRKIFETERQQFEIDRKQFETEREQFEIYKMQSQAKLKELEDRELKHVKVISEHLLEGRRIQDSWNSDFAKIKLEVARLRNPPVGEMKEIELEKTKSRHEQIWLQCLEEQAKRNTTQCKLCMERLKTIVLNCGHTYCLECATQITHCSYCRFAIVKRTEMFL